MYPDDDDGDEVDDNCDDRRLLHKVIIEVYEYFLSANRLEWWCYQCCWCWKRWMCWWCETRGWSWKEILGRWITGNAGHQSNEVALSDRMLELDQIIEKQVNHHHDIHVWFSYIIGVKLICCCPPYPIWQVGNGYGRWKLEIECCLSTPPIPHTLGMYVVVGVSAPLCWGRKVEV